MSLRRCTLSSVLPLDDPRWPSLGHRGWSAGNRSQHDPDAPFIADELHHLLANPIDEQRFGTLWPYLCSEGTAWPAAYAAVPYLVAIAQRLRPEQRGDYLYVVGLIVIYSGSYGHTPAGLPDDIAIAYRQALPAALPLLTQQLATPHDHLDTRYLLAATAALKGQIALAEFLNNLDVLTECQASRSPGSS
jgi:hypothetical protein